MPRTPNQPGAEDRHYHATLGVEELTPEQIAALAEGGGSSFPLTANVSADGHTISDLADPVDDGDAVPKSALEAALATLPGLPIAESDVTDLEADLAAKAELPIRSEIVVPDDLVTQGSGTVHIVDGGMHVVVTATDDPSYRLLTAHIYLIFGTNGTPTAGQNGQPIILSSPALIALVPGLSGGFFDMQTAVLCPFAGVVGGLGVTGLYYAEQWAFRGADAGLIVTGLVDGDSLKFAISHIVQVP